jgi:hypothetical protein
LVELVALVTLVLLVDQKKDQEQGQRLKEEDLFPLSSDFCFHNLTLRSLPAREISRLFYLGRLCGALSFSQSEIRNPQSKMWGPVSHAPC